MAAKNILPVSKVCFNCTEKPGSDAEVRLRNADFLSVSPRGHYTLASGPPLTLRESPPSSLSPSPSQNWVKLRWSPQASSISLVTTPALPTHTHTLLPFQAEMSVFRKLCNGEGHAHPMPTFLSTQKVCGTDQILLLLLTYELSTIGQVKGAASEEPQCPFTHWMAFGSRHFLRIISQRFSRSCGPYKGAPSKSIISGFSSNHTPF